MKLTAKVPLSPFVGYGNDGIGITQSLIEMGVDTYLTPGTLIDSPLPVEVAMLLTKDKQEHYDIMLHHVDPDALGAEVGTKTKTDLLVGWTMWEYDRLLNSEKHKTLRKRLADYDVMVAYDEVTKGALAEFYDGPIIVQQGGFDPSRWQFMERDWFDPDRFSFCMVGQLHLRKDPFVAIDAFMQLKQEYPEEFAGAQLHLKTSVPGLHSSMNEVYKDYKIRIYNEIWDYPMLQAFYSQMHCLVAPSRGEGKNLPALEFMSTGGIVAATNWGGHTQWLNPEYSFPIDYKLAPLEDNKKVMNARASVDSLKEQMLKAYRNRAQSKRMGEIAAEHIPTAHSWPHVMERFFQKLDEQVGNSKIRRLLSEIEFEREEADE